MFSPPLNAHSSTQSIDGSRQPSSTADRAPVRLSPRPWHDSVQPPSPPARTGTPAQPPQAPGPQTRPCDPFLQPRPARSQSLNRVTPLLALKLPQPPTSLRSKGPAPSACSPPTPYPARLTATWPRGLLALLRSSQGTRWTALREILCTRLATQQSASSHGWRPRQGAP